MKNKLILILAVLLSLCFILTACVSTDSRSVMFDITGTTWTYLDADWSYEITFGENGILKSTHPNDRTPDNDFWEQKDDIILFSYNNNYSSYEGKIVTDSLIEGIGQNDSDSWAFSIKRIH